MTSQERVTEAVRALRAARREKQSDLAQLLGVGQDTMSRKLSGQIKWSLDDLDRLSEHYGVAFVADTQTMLQPLLQGAGTGSGRVNGRYLVGLLAQSYWLAA